MWKFCPVHMPRPAFRPMALNPAQAKQAMSITPKAVFRKRCRYAEIYKGYVRDELRHAYYRHRRGSTAAGLSSP